MKTIKCLYKTLAVNAMLVLFASVALGQMPSGQRGLSMPQSISDLLWGGKASEAISEFEKLKPELQKQADAYDLLYLEMTLYRNAQMADAANAAQYKSRYESLLQTIYKKYPKNSDTYLLQIKPESTPEEVVDLTTKAIEADPTNLGAYYMRSDALRQLGRMEEAEADARKAQGL